MSLPTTDPSTSMTSRPPSYDTSRQEAGPLPSKRGELGFIEGVHTQVANQSTEAAVLPARHPADRDAPPNAPEEQPTRDQDAPTDAQASGTAPTDAATNKPGAVFKKIPLLCGVRVTTFLLFVFQVVIITVCIVAWVFTANKLKSLGTDVPGGKPSTIFVHAVFVFAMIGQLIFFERRIYRMRAERYAFLHPGEMLPRYRERMQTAADLSFAYAPWNRPPLPTYAAALAQSGHGTGDADDHLIAVPPPPAYGNTRGSTMILQGFLSDEMRAQRPVSVHSQAQPDLERGEGEGEASSTTSPETIERRRQRTLAQLQNSGPTTSGTN